MSVGLFFLPLQCTRHGQGEVKELKMRCRNGPGLAGTRNHQTEHHYVLSGRSFLPEFVAIYIVRSHELTCRIPNKGTPPNTAPNSLLKKSTLQYCARNIALDMDDPRIYLYCNLANNSFFLGFVFLLKLPQNCAVDDVLEHAIASNPLEASHPYTHLTRR